MDHKDKWTFFVTNKFSLFRQQFSKITKSAIRIEPINVKFDKMLFAASVIPSHEPMIEKSTFQGLISSTAVIVFLFFYQIRYLILIMNDPSFEINHYFVDFLYLIGSARNGMYFGFWSAIIYSIINRVIMLSYTVAGKVNPFTDWTKESKSINNNRVGRIIDPGILRLERQLLILFEFTKWSSISIILIFTVFQGLLIYLTLVDQIYKGTLLVLPFILWSLCLIPHTFYTTTGVICVYGTAVGGILHSHYKIDHCSEILNQFKSLSTQITNSTSKQLAKDHLYNLIDCVADLLSTIEGHQNVSSLLFHAFALFTTLIAASFSYVALELDMEYVLLKYCLIFASIVVWLLVIVYPLVVADVAAKSDTFYRNLCNQQARCYFLQVQEQVKLKDLIELTGCTHRPIAYNMTRLTPFTYNFHFKFLLNIVTVIFLMINIWNNNK